MSWPSPIADPGAATAVILVGVAYAAGLRRAPVRVTRAHIVSFWSGLVAAGVAVASPLDRAAGRSLTAHMVQHVLLLAVCGPLLALGAPLPALLWALPSRVRRRGAQLAKWTVGAHDRHTATWLAAALVIQAVVMWGWHVPAAYDAAERDAGLHALEHLSFVLTSAAAWWSIVAARRSRRGAAAFAALLGSLPGTVLGAALVLSPRPWYPAYPRLADQELAGVVMWAFGGMAAVVVGAGLFASWLRGAEDRRPVVLAPAAPAAPVAPVAPAAPVARTVGA